MNQLSVCALVLLAAAAVGAIRYDGFRVLSVGPLLNDDQLKIVKNIVDDDERMRKVVLLSDHMTKSSPFSLAVDPEVAHRVNMLLHDKGIPFEITDMDLQASFDAVSLDNHARFLKIFEKFRDDPTQFDHTAYLTYADVSNTGVGF